MAGGVVAGIGPVNGSNDVTGPNGGNVAAGQQPATHNGMAGDLGLVNARLLIGGPAEVTFSMAPGDRALVAAGETVVAGAPIVERIRDAELSDQIVPASADPKPGGRVHEGELLFEWRERWRVAGG